MNTSDDRHGRREGEMGTTIEDDIEMIQGLMENMRTAQRALFRRVLDDHERLLAEVAGLRARLDQACENRAFAIVDRDRARAALAALRSTATQSKAPDPWTKGSPERVEAIAAKVEAMGKQLDHVARQQIDDSNNHEERLVAIERLHPDRR